MLREAGPDDAVAIEAFLVGYAGTSMFLRGNLEAHGTQERDHNHGTRFFLREVAGEIVGVLGCTNFGYVMCQGPGQPEAFWQDAAATLEGREVRGLTGEPGQIDALLAALGWADQDFAMKRDLPLFELELGSLQVPEGALTVRRVVEKDLTFLPDWFEGFLASTELADGRDSKEDAERFLDAPDGRIGVVAGVPVAMTNFNARAFDTVQIGGVYVPVDQRGHGYGGAVVARHLAEAQARGINRAILFAASDYAVRSYERIGFQRNGSYKLAMLGAPVVVARGVVT
jgi:GNAT superfamily N-acetyltransferase